MRIEILSLFPGYFRGPFEESILGRARERGLIEVGLVNLRDYVEGRHRVVDDRPYGGGPGMVLKAEPVVQAIRARRTPKSRVVYLSPQGSRLDAAKARALAGEEHLILLCGHYEGIDQRALDAEVDEEISIGDYVLTNGCLPAIVLVDSVVRFVPGVLGHADGASEDSFEEGIFDSPHFTRPEEFEGCKVPQDLLSGDHERIERWRRRESIQKTSRVRPDLYWEYMRKVCADLPDGPIAIVADIEECRRFYRKMGRRVRRLSERAISVEGVCLVEGDPEAGGMIARPYERSEEE